MGDEPVQVAEDLVATLEKVAVLTDQETSVRANQGGIGVEPLHVIRVGARGELDLQCPQARIHLYQEVNLPLIARPQMESRSRFMVSSSLR